MENEKTEGIKKETTCLFYNLEIKEDKTPLSRKITDKKRKIAEINIKIDSYLKNNLTENNLLERDSYGYYKHILSKYMTSHINNRKNKTNGKKINNSKLNTKIYFGSFLNGSYEFDGYENIRKFDNFKATLSKSKNFSFMKNPKNTKYKKLPLDLYLSKEDSIKIRNMIDISKINNKNNNNVEKKIKKSLTEFSYDKGLFDYTMIASNNNYGINKNRTKKIFYINKNNSYKENEKEDISSKLSENIEENDKIAKTKYKIQKNLIPLKDINSNFSPNIYNNINIYNKTYNQNFYIDKKKQLLSQIDQNLKLLKENKTPKRDIKFCAKTTKQNSEKMIRKIEGLINKANLKVNQRIIINDIKSNKNNKKNKLNHKYFNSKLKIRLLSVLEKLKNIKHNAPMMIINHLYEDYKNKSKALIMNDPSRRIINNIYKSSEEGKLIKKKIDEKNYVINKFISMNQMDGIKLKNRCKKFESLVEKINEENKINNFIQSQI